MNRYRVYLHSKPGMWEYYDGYVDVSASNIDEAKRLAKTKLSRTTFKSRGPNSWVVDSIRIK